MNVVIRGGDGSVSLLVDAIGDVIEVSSDIFEAPPSTMKALHRSMIAAVVKLPKQLLLVLSPERAIAASQLAARPTVIEGRELN